jgi:hypothetical protein
MYAIQKDTNTRPLLFLLVDETDHISGKTTLTPTVSISKNGAVFASPAGVVSEIGNGWYQVAGNATDSNTLGVLVLHAAATGADPCDVQYEIVGYDPSTTWANQTTVAAIQATTDKLDDTLELDTDTYRFTANALETATGADPWATALPGTYAAGTAGVILAGVKTTTDKLDTTLEQDGTEYRFSQNALESAPGAASINSGSGIVIGDNDGGFVAVEIAGPDTIDFTIVRGDDYTDAASSAWEFTGTGWVDLSAVGTTVVLTCRKKANDTVAFTINGTIVTASATDEQVVKFQPTATETNPLAVGSAVYKYDIQANIPATPTAQIKTLVLGSITVLEDETRPA